MSRPAYFQDGCSQLGDETIRHRRFWPRKIPQSYYYCPRASCLRNMFRYRGVGEATRPLRRGSWHRPQKCRCPWRSPTWKEASCWWAMGYYSQIPRRREL